MERDATHNAAELCQSLVDAVLGGLAGYEELEARCLEYSSMEDAGLRAIAATCLGHLARRHRRVDSRGEQRLERLLRDLAIVNVDTGTTVAGYADTAMDDVRMFVPRFRAT